MKPVALQLQMVAVGSPINRISCGTEDPGRGNGNGVWGEFWWCVDGEWISFFSQLLRRGHPKTICTCIAHSHRKPSATPKTKRREEDRENGGIRELNCEVGSVAASVAAMATATQAILLAQGVPAAAAGASPSSASSSSSKLTQLAPASSSSSLYGSLAGLRAQQQQASVRGVSCSSSARAAAVSLEPPVPKQQKKSQYDITTFTTWLLKQEQAGVIDGELTIVLSSISLACKQIASLVQRAGISNMTGLQGAANIQGEDQKKLDVISNEVRISSLISLLLL